MHGLVTKVERLGPTYIRIELEGEGLDGFQPSDAVDSYINAALPGPDAAYSAPFALDDLKDLPNEERPFRRRYTVRRWVPESRTLVIEFSVHDVTGAGGRWASEAQEGDALVFTGPAGNWVPNPEADWHLLVGDESALPAIGATLETIADGASVVVRVVVDGHDDEIPLETSGSLDLEWIHRGEGNGAEPADAEILANAVRAADLPNGRCDAFIHGEAEETRAVRRHLLREELVTPGDLSCSPYWCRGRTDEEWRQIKPAWVAEMNAEV